MRARGDKRRTRDVAGGDALERVALRRVHDQRARLLGSRKQRVVHRLRADDDAGDVRHLEVEEQRRLQKLVAIIAVFVE
jgi:hypothetical protein